VALILSTLAIWKSGLFAPSQEMLSAVNHGKRENAVVSITPEEHMPLNLQPSEENSKPEPGQVR
jgi:hypothetical protein